MKAVDESKRADIPEGRAAMGGSHLRWGSSIPVRLARKRLRETLREVEGLSVGSPQRAFRASREVKPASLWQTRGLLE